MSTLLKALGVYLAIVAPIVAWIWCTVWAISTGDKDLPLLIGLAPIWLGAIATVVYIFVIRPVAALYESIKKKDTA